MDLQNLAYALTQVAHNFGAAAVVAGPLYVLIVGRSRRERGALWLTLSGWCVQIASGSLFGIISFYSYGQLPDIHGIAIAALLIKMACAIAAVAIIAVSLRARDPYSDRRAAISWRVLAGLGITALTAAAFLRWFS